MRNFAPVVLPSGGKVGWPLGLSGYFTDDHCSDWRNANICICVHIAQSVTKSKPPLSAHYQRSYRLLFILLFEEIDDILSSTHPLQRLDHCNVSCSGSSERSPHPQHLPYLRKRRRTRSLKTYSPPSIQAQCPAGFSPTPRNPLQSRGCRTDSG